MKRMSTREPTTVSRSPNVHGPAQNMSSLTGSVAAFTDATSTAMGCAGCGAACGSAYAAGAWLMPITKGPARAATPAAATNRLFDRVSLGAERFLMIASILRFRLPPLTPDTHAAGDSTESLQ